MPTLYLHIGAPKTGTTAIQGFCRENADALAARGLCFPIFSERYDDVPFDRNGYFLIAEGASTDRSITWRKNFNEIELLLQRHPNVLLSDESILNSYEVKNPALLQSVKAEADERGFEVKIIVYLRRQDEYIQSHWAQRIKRNRNAWGKEGENWKFERAVAEAKQSGSFDYYARLEGIAAVFGRENIIVKVYDRSRFKGGNIIADFLEIFGIPLDGRFAGPEREANPSLTGNALEIKRILNPIMDSRAEIGEILLQAAMACNAKECARRDCSMFSEEERRAFLGEFEESNRAVARDYLGLRDAPLFRPPEGPAEKWTPGNPHMYESIIRFFGMLIAAQQREIEELRSKFYLRRKLRWLRQRARSWLRG